MKHFLLFSNIFTIFQTSICKELVLPSSSTSFTSAMVTVVPSGDQHTLPACIAISPDGTVRCWHSISHEASYLEVSTEVKGHQCVAVITLEVCVDCKESESYSWLCC